VPLGLDNFDALARAVPTLVNLMPSGRYLMEDFAYAGGLPAVMRELGELLHRDALTVSGRTVGENVADAPCWNRKVITTLEEPLQPPGTGLAVLRGNLCPDGAVIKQSAASPQLLKHRGRALVFDRLEDYNLAREAEGLPVDAATVLVMRNAGPKGYPGMPEVGNLPLPRKLLERGITDMVRVSDARMSGTGYGTVVLHVAPEAAVGGPLALVRTGDWVQLDVPARTLRMEVDDQELSRRRQQWQPPGPSPARGYARLYVDHVLQANRGADLDFLVGASGHQPPRHNH
jgi:dihydroxy-acid dehydratase